jgi:hypothetical protein
MFALYKMSYFSHILYIEMLNTQTIHERSAGLEVSESPAKTG